MLKAEKLLKEYKSIKMGGKRMIPPNALMEIEFGELMELLDKVKLLETLQSRCCGNCKHFDKGEFCLEFPLEYDYGGNAIEYLSIEKDFYCNKWEAKQ